MRMLHATMRVRGQILGLSTREQSFTPKTFMFMRSGDFPNSYHHIKMNTRKQDDCKWNGHSNGQFMLAIVRSALKASGSGCCEVAEFGRSFLFFLPCAALG